MIRQIPSGDWVVDSLKCIDEKQGIVYFAGRKDSALESRVCAAVTGLDLDEESLYKIGERNFNLQRAVMVREGHNGRVS